MSSFPSYFIYDRVFLDFGEKNLAFTDTLCDDEASYSIYRALKDAPKECEILAEEILHLNSVLKRLRDDIEAVGTESTAKPPDERHGLGEHGARCLELLLADIGGIEKFPSSESDDVSEELKLVCKQDKALQSQLRVETSQTELRSEIKESRTYFEISQEQNLSTASALRESQIRMESQLKEILKAQSRQSNPVLAGSLDASSPEGRQTWMELGRLLREEGITPHVISENKSLLIQAMKKSLEEVAASLETASFKTAPENQSVSSPPSQSVKALLGPENSISLLSSAPTLGATFPDHFLTRPGKVTDYLEHEENIEHGMRSLMGGMTETSFSAEFSQEASEDIDLTEEHDPMWTGESSTIAKPEPPRNVEMPKLFRCLDKNCGMRFAFESQLEEHSWSTRHSSFRHQPNWHRPEPKQRVIENISMPNTEGKMKNRQLVDHPQNSVLDAEEKMRNRQLLDHQQSPKMSLNLSGALNHYL
ncbi:MAG: hypothetical protein Q9191_001574 [Dirinaria sp. TL-2023a]